MRREKATRLAGTTATILSLSMVLVGLPSQIYQNWLRHEAGISIFLAASAFVLYTAWTIYAFLKRDCYLKIAQGAGMVTSFVLLVQTIYYMIANR